MHRGTDGPSERGGRPLVEHSRRTGVSRTQSVGRRRRMARTAGAACAGAILIAVLLALSAGGGNGSYTVRAIFDDAGNIIPGEDVKIDGVKVGSVGSVTPTPQAKAAVVLNISK